MNGLFDSLRITGVAKSVTDIMGIQPPRQAEEPIDILTRAAGAAFGGKTADRVLIYNPDAIALWLFQKYTALFGPAVLQSSLQLPMLSVMPSVTPVCFASMYTGAMPQVHGIQSYTKPVVRTDTVFDAVLRAGLKPAIVSTAGNSISLIFLEREMDYFIYDSVEDCNARAKALIREDRHDLIVVYNGNYDATMHRSGTEAADSMAMLRQNIETWAELTGLAERHWAGHRTLLGFCPDHGCHDIDDGLGSHGLEMPEDMNIIHLYGFRG